MFCPKIILLAKNDSIFNRKKGLEFGRTLQTLQIVPTMEACLLGGVFITQNVVCASWEIGIYATKMLLESSFDFMSPFATYINLFQ